jgi:hypothetical protein
MTGQYTCTPDPGSKPADCATEESGLELVNVGDFSGDKAPYWYAYTDRSGVGRISSFSEVWQTSTVADPFPRCGASGPARAIRIQGGPFYGWGGGFGTSAKDWLKYAQDVDPAFACSTKPDSPFCLIHDVPDYLASAMVDASAYEGVALWARRGPDSQGGIRVNVGDKNTDDDISYLMYNADPTLPRNCERVRECGCTNHKACTPWPQDPLHTSLLQGWAKTTDASASPTCAYAPTAGPPAKAAFYCEDPNAGIVPGYQTTAATDTRCNTCDVTRCDEPYEAYPDGAPMGNSTLKDVAFNGKPCTTYTQRSGVTSGFCFDSATDPPPAESDQICGDHWMRGIYLTNDWHLYLVPFTEMQQQGFGKRFGRMDTGHVTMVRLTWDGGYVDYWIGKVAFYRHKP